MFEDIFKHKKIIFEKLEAYGFKKIQDAYRYDAKILNGEFLLEITVTKDPTPCTKLIESVTGEEYILYKTDAVGAYVSAVRGAVVAVLQDIADRCYESAVFKEEQSAQVIAYIREKYGDELEYLWDKFPDSAIWRRKDSGKWYGVMLTVSGNKLNIPSDEVVEIIDLRCQPELLQNLIDNKSYYPGWHMNKRHWYTIILDGSVPLQLICHKIDESYLLAK